MRTSRQMDAMPTEASKGEKKKGPIKKKKKMANTVRCGAISPGWKKSRCAVWR